MWLESLKINKLPGIEPGFEIINFDRRLNLVYGPNSIGKSSLLRALTYLLQEPKSSDPHLLHLQATFAEVDAVWNVERLGQRIEWHKNGILCKAPNFQLLNGRFAHFLSIENMQQFSEEDELFSSELAKALNGGFDLNKLIQEHKNNLGPRFGLNAINNLRDANLKLRGVELKYEELLREGEKLSYLREEIRAVQNSSLLYEKLLKLKASFELKKQIELSKSKIAQYPQILSRCNGLEFEKIIEIEQNIAALEKNLNDISRTMTLRKVEISSLWLHKNIPTQDQIAYHERLVERCIFIQQKIMSETQHLQKANIELKSALANLNSVEKFPKLDPNSISQVESLASEFLAVQKVYQEIKFQVGQLTLQFDEKKYESLKRAEEYVRQWLNIYTSSNLHLHIFLLVPIVLLLASVLYFFLHDDFIVAVFQFIVSITIIFYLFVLKKVRLSHIQKQVKSLQVVDQIDWTLQSIESVKRTIDQDLLNMKRLQAQDMQLGELEKRAIQVENQLEHLRLRKNEICRHVGFDPDLSILSLDRFVRLVTHVDEAQQNIAHVQLQIDLLNKEMAHKINEVNLFLNDVSQVDIAYLDVDSLKSKLSNINFDLQNTLKINTDLQKDQVLWDAYTNDKLTWVNKKKKLYEELDIPDFDQKKLKQLCDLYPSWVEEKKKIENWKIQLEQVEEEIELGVEGDFFIQFKDQIALEAEIERCKLMMTRLIPLKEEVSAIERVLKDAGKHREMEDALFAVNKAQDIVDDSFDGFMNATSSLFWLDNIKNTFHKEYQPNILKRTNKFFSLFTNYEFQVVFDEISGLLAESHSLQRLLALSHLSTGTRMQLMLAMRLAWIEQLEEYQIKLPVFLDEVLSNSDEIRFKQIVTLLQNIASSEDRQFLYLVARTHEIALWEQYSEQSINIIDLENIRYQQRSARLQLKNMELFEIPQPQKDEDVLEYAHKIKVTPLERFLPLNTHIFYVLFDKLEFLYQMLSIWNIKTVGQLKEFLVLQIKNDSLKFSQNDKNLIDLRINVLFSWFKKLNQGRGQKLTSLQLMSLEMVSDKFQADVCKLNDLLEGDATLLIENLYAKKIAGFRQNKIQELENWLIEHGFIDHSPILSREEREWHLLQEFSHFIVDNQVRYFIAWLESQVS